MHGKKGKGFECVVHGKEREMACKHMTGYSTSLRTCLFIR